ncbi:MAG TPA: NifB/NifX family molybdenum-iron cluster-binding protein [Actinotalea sp.]|nr:NifB/NifX family molybdenum-iron cluster-binding protein [Actinotalea sp.]
MPEPVPTEAVVVAVPVTAERQVDHSWGRAPRVALVSVADGRVVGWTEHAVGWDVLHDEGAEGSHHARVVRFLRENGVGAVAASHMGAPMVRTIGKLGLRLLLDAHGDAEAAALTVAAQA